MAGDSDLDLPQLSLIDNQKTWLNPLGENTPPIITSEYGKQMHPILKKKIFHRGIDIKARRGLPIFATGDGIIQESGKNKKDGLYIIIDHGAGYSSKYSHLSAIKVTEGDRILQGEEIGSVGSSGLSSSPHLHFEFWQNGIPIDPKIRLFS